MALVLACTLIYYRVNEGVWYVRSDPRPLAAVVALVLVLAFTFSVTLFTSVWQARAPRCAICASLCRRILGVFHARDLPTVASAGRPPLADAFESLDGARRDLQVGRLARDGALLGVVGLHRGDHRRDVSRRSPVLHAGRERDDGQDMTERWEVSPRYPGVAGTMAEVWATTGDYFVLSAIEPFVRCTDVRCLAGSGYSSILSFRLRCAPSSLVRCSE